MQAAGYRKSEMSETGWVPAPTHAFNIARRPEYEIKHPSPEPEKNKALSMSASIDVPATQGKTYDQIILEQLSGNVLERPDLASSTGDEQEEAEEKKKEKEFRSMAQFSQYKDFELTVPNVIESLKSGIGLDQAWLRIHESQPPITQKDMLRIDEKGNIVRPEDDPQGKYIVGSFKQKQDYETKIGACTMFYAGEEVTMDRNGKMVLKKTLDDTMRLQDRIQNSELTIRKLENGEMTPADLDPAMREDILARRRGEPTALEKDMLSSGPRSATAPEALSGPLPQTQRYPAPVQQFTPAGP